MRELLRDGRFRLMFTGQVTTMIGDSLMLVMLAIWMKDLTGSSGQAGAVMLAIPAPATLSPLLGWVVDRLRRRPFLVAKDIISAVALLPLFAVHGRDQAWVIYLVAVAYGLSFSLDSAALAGLIKHLVPDDHLAHANGALATVRESLRLGGPLAGAGIYAVAGPRPVVVLDMVSFLTCAAAAAAIRLHEDRPRPQSRHWPAEVTGGLRHLVTSAPLRDTTAALAAALLVFGTMEAGIFAYVDHGLHRPTAFVGVLASCMGVGSTLGAMLAPRLIDRIGEPGTVAAGLICMALGLGPLLYPSTVLGMAAIPLLGLGVSFALVAFSTLLQRATPQEFLGRVSTATSLLISAPQALSIAAGAVLVAHVDYRWIFAVAATGLLVTATGLWRARRPGAHASAPANLVPRSLPQDSPHREEPRKREITRPGA